MEPNLLGSQTGSWTNEKHFHFLNSMEETFVRSMLCNHYHLLPLDRPSPATAESTADSKQQIGKPEVSRRRVVSMGSRAENITRRSSSSPHPHDHTQDQVVPCLDNKSK